MNLRKIWQFVKATFSEWEFKEVAMLASSLAYFTVFSLAPLLMIVIIIVGAIFGEETAKQEIVEQLQQFLGNEGAVAIETIIENAQAPDTSENPFAILVNSALLAFGASKIFVYMQRALNRIWEIKPQPGRSIYNFIRKRILSFAMILVIAFLLLVSFVINTFLASLIDWIGENFPGLNYILPIIDFFAFLFIISILIALIYQVLPDAEVRFKDALAGGTLTALLFVLGQFVFGVFLRNADVGSAYGVAGSLVIIIVWVYYSAHILLFGAEFTQVYARRYGEPIVPAKHAIHVPTYYDHRSQEEKDAEKLLPSIRKRCVHLWRHLTQKSRR